MVKLILTLALITLVTSNNPIVILSSAPHQPILGAPSAKQFMDQRNPQAYAIKQTYTELEDLIAQFTSFADKMGVSKEQVSSFLAESHSLQQMGVEFKQVDFQQFMKLYSEGKDYILQLKGESRQPRILHEVIAANDEVGKSVLFANMTPSVLSGLFVSLFLLVVLCIGVRCVYDIKTHDKFGKNNLWVGKEA